MASVTGIPGAAILRDAGEDEPLLGRAGGASQQEGKSLWYNLIIGLSSSSIPTLITNHP
jgi:hypothetical protein